MDDLTRTYIAREYASGTALAEHYRNASHQIEQVRIFKAVAAESDYCILGFADGLGD